MDAQEERRNEARRAAIAEVRRVADEQEIKALEGLKYQRNPLVLPESVYRLQRRLQEREVRARKDLINAKAESAIRKLLPQDGA